MNNGELKINPAAEKNKITSFIKKILKKQRFEEVVVGLSGGIDSATSFYLLKEVVKPQDIFVAHLYYFESQIKEIKPMLKQAMIPKENIYEVSIAPIVKAFQILNQVHAMALEPGSRDDKVRLGNIMARVRMIILYDLAKKHNAMVCGTENKSEALLGYFTRFGDEASDIEPIQHLYKTQVCELAKHLNIPQEIINKSPTAGLWAGQTDEKEFGFSYKEADNVLYLYFEKKLSIQDIVKKGFKNAKKIIDFVKKNSYKHQVPYSLSSTVI